jgi:uncharacterized protein (TIGR02246 family)
VGDDQTRAVIERLHDAFNRHDIDALAELIAPDCVFEDTAPPDGGRFEGREAVLDQWRRFFAESTSARFEVEEMTTVGDRVVVRWRYSWADGHVRGVDLMRVRDGRVTESLAYVKG